MSSISPFSSVSNSDTMMTELSQCQKAPASPGRAILSSVEPDAMRVALAYYQACTKYADMEIVRMSAGSVGGSSVAEEHKSSGSSVTSGASRRRKRALMKKAIVSTTQRSKEATLPAYLQLIRPGLRLDFWRKLGDVVTFEDLASLPLDVMESGWMEVSVERSSDMGVVGYRLGSTGPLLVDTLAALQVVSAVNTIGEYAQFAGDADKYRAYAPRRDAILFANEISMDAADFPQQELDSGYCYLDVIVLDQQVSAKRILGRYPTLRRLMQAPAIFASLELLQNHYLHRTGTGLLHVSKQRSDAPLEAYGAALHDSGSQFASIASLCKPVDTFQMSEGFFDFVVGDTVKVTNGHQASVEPSAVVASSVGFPSSGQLQVLYKGIDRGFDSTQQLRSSTLSVREVSLSATEVHLSVPDHGQLYGIMYIGHGLHIIMAGREYAGPIRLIVTPYRWFTLLDLPRGNDKISFRYLWLEASGPSHLLAGVLGLEGTMRYMDEVGTEFVCTGSSEFSQWQTRTLQKVDDAVGIGGSSYSVSGFLTGGTHSACEAQCYVVPDHGQAFGLIHIMNTMLVDVGGGFCHGPLEVVVRPGHKLVLKPAITLHRLFLPYAFTVHG